MQRLGFFLCSRLEEIDTCCVVHVLTPRGPGSNGKVIAKRIAENPTFRHIELKKHLPGLALILNCECDITSKVLPNACRKGFTCVFLLHKRVEQSDKRLLYFPLPQPRYITWNFFFFSSPSIVTAGLQLLAIRGRTSRQHK